MNLQGASKGQEWEVRLNRQLLLSAHTGQALKRKPAQLQASVTRPLSPPSCTAIPSTSRSALPPQQAWARIALGAGLQHSCALVCSECGTWPDQDQGERPGISLGG